MKASEKLYLSIWIAIHAWVIYFYGDTTWAILTTEVKPHGSDELAAFLFISCSTVLFGMLTLGWFFCEFIPWLSSKIDKLDGDENTTNDY